MAHPQHSPAHSAVPPDKRLPQELPLKSVGGREEVSLYPRRIVAPCLPRQGQWIAWIAPALGHRRAAPFAAPLHGELYLQHPVCNFQSALKGVL